MNKAPNADVRLDVQAPNGECNNSTTCSNSGQVSGTHSGGKIFTTSDDHKAVITRLR